MNRVALALDFYRKAMVDKRHKISDVVKKRARDAAVDEYGLSGSEQTGLDEEIAIDEQRARK